MICEKCNIQFKSGRSISEAKTMLGLCVKCGTRLKYHVIPNGFTGGCLTAICSAPLFMIYLFNVLYVPIAILGVAVTSFLVWLMTNKFGGKVTTESVVEYKKGNIVLSFVSGFVGFVFTFMWSYGIILVLN